MTWHRERSLWSSAILGSVIIHAALGAALALTPAMEEVEKRDTVITIHSIPEAFTQQAETGGEATQSEIAAAEVGAAAVMDVASAVDQSKAMSPAIEAHEADVASDSEVTEQVEATTKIAALEAAAAMPRPVVETHVALSSPAVGAMVEAVADAISTAPVGGGVVVAPTFGIAAQIQPVSPASVLPSPIAPASATATRDPSVSPAAVTPAAFPLETVTQADVAAAVSSAALSPSSPQARPAPFAVTNPARPMAAGTGTAVAPVGADTEVAVAVRPDVSLVLEPRETAQDVLARVRTVIDDARKSFGDCFIAKSGISADEVAVEGFAVSNAAFEQLSGAIEAVVSTDVALRRRLVADSQCAALAFTATGRDELEIELSSSEIASGAQIAGAVKNISRSWFYLLTVDGEGLVQEVGKAKLASAGEGRVSFATPVTLTGTAGETVQLIVAIASDQILETVWLLEGASSAVYFPQLRAEIEQAGASAEIGLASFTVR